MCSRDPHPAATVPTDLEPPEALTTQTTSALKGFTPGISPGSQVLRITIPDDKVKGKLLHQPTAVVVLFPSFPVRFFSTVDDERSRSFLFFTK